MKIVVTGGAGFIGSHIADAYIQKGHRVAIIDNLLTGSKRNLDSRSIFYKADIRNSALMERIMKKERPEIVNHHAAIAEVAKSVIDPLPTFETNVLGTINILRAFGVHGKGKKKFIFASTGGAIYGNPSRLPASEATLPAPLSPYGLSKLMAEEAIVFYAHYYKFPYLMLRYANVYGPRQNPHGEAGVVAIFGGLMNKGKRPTIFGDGTKTRDYVYVKDVAHANVLGLARGTDVAVNIGGGKEVSDQMIFDAVGHHTRFPRRPVYAPFRAGEVKRIALDARRATRVLGWKPRMALREGIEYTLATL